MSSTSSTKQSAFTLLLQAMEIEEESKEDRDLVDILRLYENALRALRSVDTSSTSSSTEVRRAMDMARDRAKYLRSRLYKSPIPTVRKESSISNSTGITWEQSLRSYNRESTPTSGRRVTTSATSRDPSKTASSKPLSDLDTGPLVGPVAKTKSASSNSSSPSNSSSSLTEMEKQLEETTVLPESMYSQLDFESVVGQVKAKRALMEGVVLPQLRPDLFDGLLSLNTCSVLLFGPPGNGKSLMVKALATALKTKGQKHVLLAVTAASLTSKYIGEGEKMVRNLFSLATKKAPSIVFIDEIDSILTARSQSEHEASRRLKTEFFTAFDSLSAHINKCNKKKNRVLVVAATNRPQELDTAAIRRFTKRIHVEMPDYEARLKLLDTLLAKEDVKRVDLSPEERHKIAQATNDYSNSDLTNLVREAAMGPLREIDPSSSAFLTVKKSDFRPMSLNDFVAAIAKVRPSVNKAEIEALNKWNALHGDIS